MIDKKFIINLQGNEFVKFEGLLAEFHANGGKEITSEELPTSTQDEPKFKATVTGERGTFTGHGDANNSNTNRLIAAHKYRMAETRAIARALRWYNNIGLCSFDELGGDEPKPQVKPKQTALQLLRVKVNKEAGDRKLTDEETIKIIADKSGVNLPSLKELTEQAAKNIIELWF